MISTMVRAAAAVAAIPVVFFGSRAFAGAPAVAIAVPEPATASALATTHGEETAVFAGGCFWGIEAVFEHIKGVKNAESGYAGGTPANPDYNLVSTGMTGHAESVRVVFDPAVVSYATLLKVFFSVAHDPTQLNRQGPDTGTQYRSEIFYVNAEQKKQAEAYIAQLTAAKAFPRPVVTKVEALQAFYVAEDYHQDYMVHHPNQPYIVYNDAPKVANLKAQFPALYRGE